MRALRLKKKGLRGSLFVALTTALLLSLTLGFFSNSANAVLVSSTTSECQVDVGNTTGVTLTLSGGKCFLTFTSAGTNTWTAPAAVRSFNVIVVAGGGGGGPDGGSGGGSGSLYEGSVSLGSAVSPTFNISVGVGGNRGMHTAPSGQTRTDASAGGNSVFSASAQGLSITSYGGGPGDWPNTSSQKAGGYAGATPTVSSGSLTVAATTSTAGRAGANAPRADTVQSGLNGSAGVTSALFGGQFIGSGGSGAIIGNGSTPGGSASDGGGRGGGGNNNNATSFSMPGTNGTGGGGGGGSRNAPVGEIWLSDRSDHSRNGSAGGSGIIGISYTAPKLTTATASSVGALLNVPFFDQPRIQLTNSANVSASLSGVVVTATPSRGTLINNTATTSASGRADFSGLQFTSGGLGSVTITFSAPGYASVSQVVTIQTLATDITISAAASSNGRFVNGRWLANSAATSNINASALATEISSRPVTIEASAPTSSAAGSAGNISVQASVSQQLWNDQTLTLKATRSISFANGVGISVTDKKLNVVLWSDSDGTNSGSVSLAGGSGSWALNTNGGHVAIGGGTASTAWNALTIPSGYAAGEGDVSSAWWGVEFGVNQATSNRKIINTGGGNLRVYGEAKQHSSASVLYGVLWEGGEISTGVGTVEVNGKTTGSPSTASNQNFGVGIGANGGSVDDAPLLNTTAAVSIAGTTSVTTADHMGVYIRGTTLNAGSSVVSINTDRQVKFDAGNSFSSRVNVTSGSHIFVPAANTFTGASADRSASLTSTNGWVEVQGAVTTSSGLEISCPAGGFSSNASGTISSSGTVTIDCGSVETLAAISSAGSVSLTSSGASSSVSVGGNITTTTTGANISLRSKSNILVRASVTVQTAGRSSGSGGNIVLWSDSDASGQGYIWTYKNTTFNSIGGSTTAHTGGGDIHFGGGEDNGANTVMAGRAGGDGIPDGWAADTTTIAINVGEGATSSADINTINTGGGNLTMFAKTTSGADGMAFNWTSRVDSGEGQIDLRAESAGWGLQLNRSGNNDTYTNKSIFTSRSASHPAIYMSGKSSTTTGEVALLGSWGDVGKDNLLIQALGTGGVHLVGEAPNTTRAPVSLTSTAVLSASGDITVDGGTRGIHFGRLDTGHSVWGDVTLGSCLASVCSNSLVTSSTANVNLIGNRITTVDSASNLNTFINTSGTASILPLAGTTAFTEFQAKTAGLTLSENLGGLQIGRPGDTTASMTLSKDWKIAGPITVNAGDIVVSTNVQLETTAEDTSPIRLLTTGRIYTATGVDLITNGSDVVFWTAIDKVDGTAKPSSNIYLDPMTITTNGGKIWLAGGRDDGGTDAQITASRGKWSSVIAGDGLPDGYATGRSTDVWDQIGVLINRGTVLNSGGGDIFIAGASGPTGSGYAHIGVFPDVKIDSGIGRIAMWGRALGTAQTHGIRLNWDDNIAPVLITSNATTADAISIYSDSSASSGVSPGITAWAYGALNSASHYQGNRIAATASGGGVTLTGIGSAANVAGANGINLDFIDIFAIDGPITLNGDSTTLNDGSVGVAFGWVNNVSSVVRLGGWTAGNAGGTFGNMITTPGGVTANFGTSSSDVTINTDSFWNRVSSWGMIGVYLTTTGDVNILPSNLSSGLVSAADSFKTTQNGGDWSFEKLNFQLTPETVTIGRPATVTATRIGAPLTAHGAIKVYGSALDFVEGVTNVSGRGAVLLKSSSTLKLSASKTYQTNGSDLVLWSGSAGGNGYIEVGNSVCINTNASCDLAVATATGNIYIGGGAAGTDFPTGPAVGTSTNGVSFGTTTSGIRVLSGGGDISVKGQGSVHGVSSFQGITFKATTGAIDLQGSTTVTGNQALRFGAATGDTVITSAKTSGTAIRLRGTYSTHSAQWGVVFTDDDSTISATGGGDIVIEAADATSGLNSKVFLSRVTATTSNGGRIQVKATGRNEIHNSSILTAGPASGAGGEISIWADSDNDDTGSIYVTEPACISTIGTCSAPANTGGSKIVIGGGAADSSDSFFPAGGAVARTGDTFGVRFGSTHAANGVKIFSGGGDLRIASEQTTSTTTNDVYGQLWYGGTQLHSGNGMVELVNTPGVSATGVSSYGLYIHATSGAPISVISTKSSGDAIKVVSTTHSTGNYSTPVLAYSSSTTDRVTFNASGGGKVDMTGNAQGTGAETYSYDLNNVDLLSTSGNIKLSGNRGYWLNRLFAGSNNFGATSTTSSSGNIELLGNRYNQNSTHANNFKTTGSVTIAPLDAAAYLEATEFPKTGNTFNGVTALTFGNDTNTQSHTVGAALSGVSGAVTFKTGNYTGTGSLSSTNGPISILSSGTVALNANITSGANGVLVKSTGRITTSVGASVAVPRAITTNSGPITLWTTGAAGGVTLNNYVHLNSNSSGAGGADITIGGGSADVNDASIPGGNAASSANSGIILGTSNVDQIVRISAGTGDIVIRGESTTSSASRSGIDMVAGVKIIGGTVDLFGKANNPSTTNNTAAGIFHYQDSTTAKTLIEGTKSFVSHATAVSVRGETSSGTFGMMLSNIGDAATVEDAVTIRTTGNNADINITGSTGLASGYSVQAAGLRLSTATGDVLVDSGNDPLGWSRTAGTRKVSYVPVTGQPGGNVTLRTPDVTFFSSGSFNVTTAGVLTLEPPVGQSFSRAQTFPLASSVIDVGGLVVGSEDNTDNLTQGAAITSSGDVRYLGGAQTGNFAITTSGSADIAFYPTTTFAKSTPLWSAGGDILIGTADARATTVSLSTSTLTAGGDLRIYSNQNVTQSAAISAAGAVVIDTSGATGRIEIDKGIAAGAGGILLKANQDILVDTTAKNITTSGGGDIVFWASASGTGGDVDTGGLSVVIDSNGGDIVIAGGADDGANGGTASDGIPDNSLVGRTANHSVRLLGLMDSDAGSIVIRAQHSAHAVATALGAIYLADSARIRSTTGDISIIAKQNSGNTSTNNQYGVWLGQSTATASRAKVSSTSGDIFISGDSSQSDRSNRRGVLLYGVDISTGGDVEIFGKAPSRTGVADVVTWAPSSIAADGTTLIEGAGINYLESTSIASGTGLTFEVGQLVGTDGLSSATFTSTALSITGSGPVTIRPDGGSFTATQSLDAINFASTVSSLTIGKTGNTAGVTVAGVAKTIAGDITTISGSLTTSTALTSSTGNVSVTADSIDLGANLVASSGVTTIAPQTADRTITAGTEVANTLSLTSTELGRITTGTLRLNTDGNVNVTASTNFTGKVTNLAIRAGGNVTGSAGVVITVANLGIDAGGTINFPGNQVASTIALQGSTITYNQTADYAVAAVDGIDPEFGYGVRFAIANVPVSGTLDGFMAVTFNPPPTVTIRDKFGNTLAANNTSAADYAVSTAFTLATTTSGTPVASGTTPTRSGGTFTFSDLKVVDGTGTGTFTFSATRGNTALTENSQFVDGASFVTQSAATFTTATYNIQAGEPASIELSFAATSAPAGKTGLAPTATLKDVGGNTIVSGPHANATITIAIAGSDGTIVSGATATTVNGVASFPNLVLGGKVNTDYTLTFSVTFQDTQSQPVTVSEDEVVTLTFGDASKVTLGAATQTVANRTNLANIVATIRDAYDNVVTDSTASVALAFDPGATLGLAPVVSGYSAQNATAGVATFSGISLAAKADSYTITASSGALATANQVVTVTHGEAHSITLTAPATATNDVVFGTQPVVRILDQEGNLVTTGTQSTQTVTLSATGATIDGTVSMAAVAGEADFTGKLVKLTGTIGSITLKAAITSPSTIEDSESITLGFGSATKLAITRVAAGFVNRTNFTTQPKVTVQDVSGNTVTNFTGEVALSIGSGASITGDLDLTLVAGDLGVATFSGLGLQGTIGSYTITASSSNLTSATQTGVALTHGAAASVALTIPATVTNDAVFGVQPEARILDADGNLVSTGTESTQDVVLSSSNATIAGNLTQAAVGGVADFTGIKLTSTIGSRSVTATISTPSATDTETTTVTFGSATKLAITQAAAGFVNRTNFTTQPKVTVQDVSGNTVTNFAGEVALSIGSGASITGDIDLTLVAGDLGVATFSGLGLQGTIGSYTITASSSGLTSATQTGVALTHGQAYQVELTTPATATNDVVFGTQPEVRILDQDGNLVTTGTDADQSVQLSVAGATLGGVATVNAEDGVATFSGIKLTGTIGSKTFTATITSPSSISDTSTTTVTFGSATKLAITQAAAGFVNRTDFTTQPKVTVQDVSGNTVTNFAGNVELSIGAGATITGTRTLTLTSAELGVATFSGLGLQGTIGTYTITAASGSLTVATQDITLTHGAAHSVVLTSPASVTNDAVFGTQPSVEILDEDGNRVTTGSQSSQQVTITSTATLTGTASMNAVQGVANFTGKGLKLTDTVGGYIITATIESPEEITDENNISITFGSATKLAITQAAAGFVNRTNFTTQPKVTVQDVSGNTVTNFAGNVELSIGAGASITGTRTLTLTSAELGVASFSGLGLQGTIGTYTITASSTNLTSATQTGVALTHGEAAKVVVTAPANAQSNVVFGTQPVVEILDADDNPVATGPEATQVVTLTATGATLSGTNAQSLAMAAVAGEANFTGKGLKLEGSLGTKTLTATISSPSSISGNASIELGFGEAVKLSITQAAAGFVNRTNFTTQPKVTVQDVSGNTVTNFTGEVALSIGSGASITGDIDLTLVAGDLGVATFSGLGLQGNIGSYTITASSSNLTSATQTGVALTHGAAASVALTIPATVTNDAVFGVQPQARILDADGNLVSTGTESTQNVVLSSSNATIAGTLTQPAVGGVADFTGIKLTSTIGSRSVTATISSPSATDTETTTVTFGSATKLAITQAAAGFVNRTNFTTQPKVTVQDVSGNTVTNFTGTIGLAVSAGATLTGTTSVTISGTDLGVASFSGVGIFGPIATYTLTFSSGALDSATQSAAITHGAAHSLQVTAPATSTNAVVFGTQPVVRILDRDGNLVTTGPQSEQTVTLSATGAVLDGTVSMPAVAGEADFTGKDLKLTGLIGPKPLKASISSPETIEATATITLQFGAATQLALTQAAAGFVNRTDFTTQPIVEVRDVSGNAVTNYSGTVSIAVGSGVTFSGTPSVVLTGTQSGLASFTGLGLYGTVGNYTLTYSSGSLTTATQSVNLTHGVATQLSVTTEADGARAGIVFDDQPVVKVLDQDSNLVLTGDAATSNIRVQSSGATLSGTVTALAEGGIATFSGLKLSGTVGTYQLSYSALSPALAAGFTTQTHDIELAPGVATEIHITEQPSAVIAGEALDPVVSVQLRDDWQNVVTTDSTSTVKPVLVDATTEAVIDSSVSATAVTNGAVSFTGLSFTSAGQRKLKFESGAITELSDSFTITHAAASQIVWTSTAPSSMRNEIELSPAPSFEIRDQFGNPSLTGPRFTVTASVVGGNSANVLALAGETITQASSSAAISFPALSVKAPQASYQLRFTAVNGATSFSVDSTAIPLTFGVPTQLSISTPAATAGAGLAFGTQPVVHILDSAGNLVADSTLTITATVAGRDLVGLNSKAAVGGIADFAGTDLGINGAAANGLNLVFATEYPAGTPITASQTIDVSAGVATLVSMIQQPTTLVTRQSFSPDVTVELRDQFGNKVESDSSSSVSVVLYDITGQPAVATTGQPALTAISAVASQGVATFSGLGYAVAPGTGYYLRVSLGGFTISSSVFDVLPGAATSIEIDVQPSTSIGSDFTPTGELIQVMPEISLYDQDGYLATTTNGTATISATNSGDLSEGSTSATVTNGQAEFAGIKLVGTPGQNYSLVFAFGSVTKTSAAMQVTHNVATKIVLDRAAANGRSHEPFVTQPIVKILDRYNNLVTSGSGSSLDLRVVSSGGSVSGANISASGGIGTFTGLSLGGAVNTDYTFTYEATFRQDIATATQTEVQVGYGFASQLRIHQEPVSLASGVLTKTGDALATQPVIHVTDNWGNIVENSSIQITASLFATQDVRDRLVSATATAVNGVATFSGLSMVVRPETDYKIKFAAGSLNKTSGNIQVRHGDATALRIITEPSSVDGSGLTMTGEVLATTPVVEAIDFDGNRATSVTGDIATATVSVGGGEAVVDLHSGGLQHNQAAFTAGVAAFQNLKVVALPGVEQKLAFDASIASTAVATAAPSAGFVLTNNVANKLAVLTQPCAGNVVSVSCSTGITGDTMLVQPVIEIQDRYGNRVPEFAGDVEIATSTAGSSILVSGVSNPTAQKATAVSGVATFSGIGLIALPSAQTQFSFTSPNLLSTTSANVAVAAAAPHKLVMATQPAGGRTGDALATQPVIHVLDRFNNHVLSDNSTVVTASIGSGAGGTLTSVAGSATAVSGVVSFTDLVFSGVPNANYTLSFGSGSLTSATSNTFSVTNGLAAGLNITSEPVGGKTGDLLSNLVELELLDDELNLAADDNSTVVTVAFAVTDGYAEFVDSSHDPVTPSVTADGGVVDFGDLRIVGTPGYTYKLVFTATPTSGPSYNSPQSAGFTLTHANPAAVVVTQSPVGGIVGGVLATQPTLRINDRFGNHATSDNSTTVSVSIFSGTGGNIVSGGSATAVGGVVSFGAIAASGTPGELYQLRFSATAANSATFSVDDTVGFRLSKTASLTFSYAAVDYAPDAIVSPTFATDSPATPIFTTNSSASVCELVLDPTTSAPNGQIRVKGVGSCVVSVTIPNAPFYATISATETLVINKAQQAALVITSVNNVDYWSTMTPTATGGSGTGAVSFLLQGDCRIIGTTLIPGNAGNACEITARKLGDANYLIAYSDPMNLTINKISQTPLRMANANTAAMIDLALFTSGGSGTGEVTFQITTNRSVAGVEQCALVENGTRLRALSSGTCGVSATKATSTNHLVAISPEQTVTFTKAEQRVNFTSSIPAMPLVGSIYTPVAVASSGLPVTYTITSGSGAICAWDTDPTKIKFLAAGSCEITATQVGDGQFSQASNTQTIVVNARNQTINFAELANRTYGQPGFFLQATATSDLPVSFSVGPGSGSPACAISSGNFVNLLSAGSCEIIATQIGNQEYLAATPVKHIFTIAADLAGAPHLISISAGNQTVTASFNPPSYNGGSPITAYRLVATAANGDTYVNPGCPIGTGPVSCSLVGVPNAQPGVLNSGVYSLKVAAITIAGIGNYSMDSRAITASAGDMGVTNLIANPSVSTLTLNWDAPAALDSTFQEYEIYVWPLGGEEPETPTTKSTATSATFSTGSVAATSARRSLFSVFSGPTSIAPADAYEFKVVTITSQTQSADENLNTTFGMQQSFTIPGQPTQLQLQELPEKLSLGWSIPAFDGGKPILSYTVKVNGETECEATSARICDFAEPRAGMTYEFEVFATNSIGDGAVATYSITMPAPPSTGVYVGPLVTHVMPNPAKPGALVLVVGAMLDIVETISIAGRELEFSIASSNALSVRLPVNIAEGLYDIVITSSYGRLTVQDALLVSLDATSPEIDPETDPGTDSESGSGSQENSGSDGQGGTDPTDGSSTDNGSSDGGATGPGTDSQGGSQENSGSDGSGGESEAPVPIDADQGDFPSNVIGFWWIPVLALLLTLLAARRVRAKAETKQ